MAKIRYFKGQNLGGIRRVYLFDIAEVQDESYENFIASNFFEVETSELAPFSLSQNSANGLYQITLNIATNHTDEEVLNEYDSLSYKRLIVIVVDANQNSWIFGTKQFPCTLRYELQTGESARGLNGITAVVSCESNTSIAYYENSQTTNIADISYFITNANFLELGYYAQVFWSVGGGLAEETINIAAENLRNNNTIDIPNAAPKTAGNYSISSLVFAGLEARAGDEIRFSLTVTDVTGNTSEATFFNKLIPATANITATFAFAKSNLIKLTWTENINGTTEFPGDRLLADIENISQGTISNLIALPTLFLRGNEECIVLGAFGSPGDLVKIRYRMQNIAQTISSQIAETATLSLASPETFSVDVANIHFAVGDLVKTINITSTESWFILNTAGMAGEGITANATSGGGNFALVLTSNLYQPSAAGSFITLENATGQRINISYTAQKYMEIVPAVLRLKYDFSNNIVQLRTNVNWRKASSSDPNVAVTPASGLKGVQDVNIFFDWAFVTPTLPVVLEEDATTPAVTVSLPVSLELFNVTLLATPVIQADGYKLTWEGNIGAAGDEIWGLPDDRVVIEFKNLTTNTITIINESAVRRDSGAIVRIQSLGTVGQIVEVKVKCLRQSNSWESLATTQNVTIVAS